MRRTRPGIVLLGVILVGVATWYLFVPPEATGTPAYQPYRIEPDVSATNYRVTANYTATCHNATTTQRFVHSEVGHVDRETPERRSRRVVRVGDRTFVESVYANGSGTYRRVVDLAGDTAYEYDPDGASTRMELQRYEPVFPRLLTYEWAAPETRSGREIHRPREGYWVDPAEVYGIDDRTYVESASGRLVTSDEGTLLRVNLTATTATADTRFDRYLGRGRRCSVHLEYRFEPVGEPVTVPDWVVTAADDARDA